jgi:hypothetical protein
MGIACVCGTTGAPCPNGQLCNNGACGFRPGYACHGDTDCSNNTTIGSCSAGVCAKNTAGQPCIDPGDCVGGTTCLATHKCG